MEHRLLNGLCSTSNKINLMDGWNLVRTFFSMILSVFYSFVLNITFSFYNGAVTVLFRNKEFLSLLAFYVTLKGNATFTCYNKMLINSSKNLHSERQKLHLARHHVVFLSIFKVILDSYFMVVVL